MDLLLQDLTDSDSEVQAQVRQSISIAIDCLM